MRALKLTAFAALAALAFGQTATPRKEYRSKIAIFDLAKQSTEVVFEGDGIIEAPNWSRDGRFLLVNREGGLYRLPLSTRQLERIPLDGYRCNNDHDLSPDGKWLAFSASTNDVPQSRVFVSKADGADVRLLTPKAPSYFHGWSPDGKWLAFVGRRDGKFELYRVAFDGGEEQRLTSAGAYDDGPDYTPDGRWIYFNSDRSGSWDIWRIPAEGAGPNDAKAERVTGLTQGDDWEDWFPHVSPNGRHLIWFSFPKGTKGHSDRMPGVILRYRDLAKPGGARTLTTFFGGQGTINVNSWSPDSKRFAYVIFEEKLSPTVK